MQDLRGHDHRGHNAACRASPLSGPFAARGLAAAALLTAGCGFAAWLHADEAPDPLGEKTGGVTTVYATGKNAFSFPLANLDDPGRTRFVIGNSFFKRNWVEAPASPTDATTSRSRPVV